MTCLLLLIAYGWSIYFIEFEDADVFLPLSIMSGVLHVVIIGLSQITENEHYKFHDFENWAGIVLVVIRIMFFVYGITLFLPTYARANPEEKIFYKRFGILATCYLMAFPVILGYSTFGVKPWNRHALVVIGNLLV